MFRRWELRITAWVGRKSLAICSTPRVRLLPESWQAAQISSKAMGFSSENTA